MHKLYLVFILGVLVGLSSCKDVGSQQELKSSDETIDNRLDLAVGKKYLTLDPAKITDVGSFYIVNQIYEGLLKFDAEDLSVEPSLAESWEVSDNGLVYTFNLKEGIYFHDNNCFEDGKGREVRASDVLYSFKRICSDESNNSSYFFFKEKIVGAKDFYDSSKKNDRQELKGVKVIDDFTIQFTLNNPSSTFLESIASFAGYIVAQEAIEKGEIVGSGPFYYLRELDTQEHIILSKNENYHVFDSEGERLPYLDAVAYHYLKKSEQLEAFVSGELDAIRYISNDAVKGLLESQLVNFQEKPLKYFLLGIPKMSTSFLELNTTQEPLNDKLVRQAIAHAIDKNRITENVLKGNTSGPAYHGIVPPTVEGYDYSSVIGLEFNVDKAKRLLTKAGYENGEGFPELIFNAEKDNRGVRIALDIQEQLSKNLNIKMEITTLDFHESSQLITSGKANISHSTWVADYPDALDFLSLTYGALVPESLDEHSFLNTTRYVNPEFDKIYEEASETSDKKRKMELCLQADQMVVIDAPIIPLWHGQTYGLMQSTVTNFHFNALVIDYLAEVKIVQKTKKK